MTVFVACLGCHESIGSLAGSGSGATRAGAEQLFAALGARVTEPLRDPRYDTARVKIGHAAFLPSRVWDDSTVWTAGTPGRRTLLISGRLAANHYRLEAARAVPPPSQLADSRHAINLTRLSDDEYAWDTEVAYGLGTISATEVATFMRLLLSDTHKKTEQQVRMDYRASVPRATAVLGQLFTVDSIRSAALPDGTTQTLIGITLTPAGVESRYPDFAKYMRNYGQTARMRWTLTDRSGLTYLEGALGNGRILLRLRTNGAGLVAMGTGAPLRSMPDTLIFNAEMTLQVRRFTMGFHDYHADFLIVRTEHESSWLLVSRSEPKWVLPLGARHLIRAPLRRPFSGNGSTYRLGVRDSVGGQTILLRRMHLEVQESAVLRVIGRLSSTAMSDYAGLAERQQQAWLREVFSALVADVRALP